MMKSCIALCAVIFALASPSVGSPSSDVEKTKGFRFLNKNTTKHRVQHLPDIPFDLGEMYSGLMPVTQGDDSRQIFYIFQPTINKPVDELTVWFNGGPGCSSLTGFLEENGRFVYNGGMKPVINKYSWVNQTNMLWVEYPIGVGYNVGQVTAATEEEAAVDFIGFFKNFQETYGIKNFKIFVTGESYAGRYVPYVSAAILDQNDTEYYNLQGALVYDPCIGQFVYSAENAVAYPFVNENQEYFGFSQPIMNVLESLHSSCGYESYLDTYLQFPPPGIQPRQDSGAGLGPQCDIWDEVVQLASRQNKCFDVYEVNVTCPAPYDPLADKPIYFNRTDVKKAIHAPLNSNWRQCSRNSPFTGQGLNTGYYGNGDISLDPIQAVLPQVIEATNRVLVGNGDYDFIIISNGTLVSIQNMTFNGQLGFQQPPSQPIIIPGVGQTGIQHYERGLMYAETFKCGHFEPEFEPPTSFRHLQWLRKERNSL